VNQDRFDDLTRCLATGVSRRHMLKLLFGAASGIFASQLAGCQTTPQSTPTPAATASPTATPCNFDGCAECVDAATDVFTQAVAGCISQYPEQTGTAYDGCIEAAARTTLASVDNCVAPASISGVPASQDTVFASQSNAKAAFRAAPEQASANLTGEACNSAELDLCREELAEEALAKLLACAVTACINPIACRACVGTVLSEYAVKLKQCIQRHGCADFMFCSNNVCCEPTETGCGSNGCCTRGQFCENGVCRTACNPPLKQCGGVNYVCCDPCDPCIANGLTGIMTCASGPFCGQCEECDAEIGQCRPIPGAQLCGEACCGSCQTCDNGACRSCNTCETCDNGVCIRQTGVWCGEVQCNPCEADCIGGECVARSQQFEYVLCSCDMFSCCPVEGFHCESDGCHFDIPAQ
jgi:hypothetical protein